MVLASPSSYRTDKGILEECFWRETKLLNRETNTVLHSLSLMRVSSVCCGLSSLSTSLTHFPTKRDHDQLFRDLIIHL